MLRSSGDAVHKQIAGMITRRTPPTLVALLPFVGPASAKVDAVQSGKRSSHTGPSKQGGSIFHGWATSSFMSLQMGHGAERVGHPFEEAGMAMSGSPLLGCSCRYCFMAGPPYFWPDSPGTTSQTTRFMFLNWSNDLSTIG
jgi:hypothetical protein